ncbi:hypothetical protein NIES4071_70460 [Calothrix sp. NIES-4071]|nr:hypothetical protein NIES4071_70460 [Calothrix sp. NIES-4071]BAZ61321.1 hypothetical protein NIES4105_70410 [Calothrix sp. NIES-4105]
MKHRQVKNLNVCVHAYAALSIESEHILVKYIFTFLVHKYTHWVKNGNFFISPVFEVDVIYNNFIFRKS